MAKKVTMLLSDRFKTRFMQDADVFEGFKVLVMPPVKATVVRHFGKKHIEAILRQCDSQPYDLVAIYDDRKTYYRNPNVKVISDGEKWGLLDDLCPGGSK